MSSKHLSTAGAIPVVNQKGEVTMQTVKVQRYITGRKPEYAEGPSSDSDSDDELHHRLVKRQEEQAVLPSIISSTKIKREDDSDSDNETADNETPVIPEEAVKSDRRLQRLMNRVRVEDSSSGRTIREPQVLEVRRRPQRGEETSESEGEEEKEEDEVERRHALLRRLKQKEEEETELLAKQDIKVEDTDNEDDDSDEDDDDEEYTSSDEEEEALPRLKPVFVRKEERITAIERELEEKKEQEKERQALKETEERRQESLKIIEEEVKREVKEAEEKAESEAMRLAIDLIDTDDEGDEEVEYELWKVRELTRIRRDKEEREAAVKEEEEKERLRNMTEEERQLELQKNPKVITNQASKGKYKYLQKYFHRGAYYLDQEDHVFKRDFAEPTLEDHFDKSVLPSVMQVKNFGRSGRTKYTHLVDQDTTVRDSPWTQETPQTSKMMQSGGGFKPVFERPSKKRKV